MQRLPNSNRSATKITHFPNIQAQSCIGLFWRTGYDGHLPGLKTEKICDTIAFCADFGEGEDLPDIKRKAVQAGSSKVNVEDLLEEWSQIRSFRCFGGMRCTACKFLFFGNI